METRGNIEHAHLGKNEKLHGWSIGHVEENESEKGDSEDIYYFGFGRLWDFIFYLKAVEHQLRSSQSVTRYSM